MNFTSERYQLFATTLASSGGNIEVQVNQVQRESGRLVEAVQHSMRHSTVCGAGGGWVGANHNTICGCSRVYLSEDEEV